MGNKYGKVKMSSGRFKKLLVGDLFFTFCLLALGPFVHFIGLVYGLWSSLRLRRLAVLGSQSRWDEGAYGVSFTALVIGHWSLVVGLWSLVFSLWSLVVGLWSLVFGL